MLLKGSLILSFFIVLNSCDWLMPSHKKMQDQLAALSKGQKTLLIKLTNIEKQIQKDPRTNIKPAIPMDKVYNVAIGDSFVYGNKNAPITLIKWLDFQCPYCAQSVSLVDAIMKKYPNDVKVVFKNFPLTFHKQAKTAAKYSLAAEKQGKYLEMYHEIYKNYRNLKSNEDYPLEIAKNLGLDVEKLKKDFNDPSIEKRITDEVNQLRTSGIARLSVPKFLINGKEPRGRDLDLWTQMIDTELKKLKGKEKKG